MTGDIPLSIIVTVVSGKECLRRCLQALDAQAEAVRAEVIVPYDRWCPEVSALESEFPRIRFHRVESPTASRSRHVRAHALYDARRAVGLALARGRIVAMTEDHAVPAADWCRRILEVHDAPQAAIGGAIENGVDRPWNWALYYCDFGRYGRPLTGGEATYASDVNVAYKRNALESIREIWADAYHEPLVHGALRARGEVVVLDPRMVVYQQRPPISPARAYAERVAWGRAFAETRAAGHGFCYRLAYAAGTPMLPALLLVRVIRHMVRQRRSLTQLARVLPLAFWLLTGWAFGECIGYISGAPDRMQRAAAACV